jgi:hypothetical protein
MMKTCKICPGKHDLAGDLCPLCQIDAATTATLEKISRLDQQMGEMAALTAMLKHCKARIQEIQEEEIE